tara:strand:- start:2049 stop:2711 length:663 start_codon:yes stop_codon:yes gene_type:complete
MISCRQVTRTFVSGDRSIRAVQNVDLDVDSGEFLAITGASGSGKSTLLHLMGSLDTPDSGELEVAGLPLHSATEAEKTRFRQEDVGIIFQFFNLMPTLTVAENVMMPLLLRGERRSGSAERAAELLDLVGLGQRRDHLSHQLSGGEMQRVAIARALAPKPKLIVADEPTGNLDSKNRDRVLEILGKIHGEKLATMVVVTHEDAVAEAASRQVEMRDGKLV